MSDYQPYPKDLHNIFVAEIAYNAVNIIIADIAVPTDVAFDNEIFDPNECYNPATFTYTAAEAGLHFFGCGFMFHHNAGAGGYSICKLYKNGSEEKLFWYEYSDNVKSKDAVVPVVLAVGDAIKVVVEGNTGMFTIYRYLIYYKLTRFWGYMIRS